MAISKAAIRYLFDPNVELISSLFPVKFLDHICKVLNGRHLYYIVEPYPEDKVRVFVKAEAYAYLRDLIELSNQTYPFVREVTLDEELWEAAKFLPWHGMGGDSTIQVDPQQVVTKLVSLVPPGREEDLAPWEQHFLFLCQAAIRRGIWEVIFVKKEQ